MRFINKKTLLLVVSVFIIPFLFLPFINSGQPTSSMEEIYRIKCAHCHGIDMTGGNASSLVDGLWQFGSNDGYIIRNIKFGIPHLGMPSYQKVFSDSQIRDLVKYIKTSENKIGAVKPPIPDKLETTDYFINVEVWIENLEIPWGIAFVSEEFALVTERPGRLREIRKGKLLAGEVIGTPKVLNEGQGGLLGVAVDPNYKENGWIYLSYSHGLKQQEGGGRPPAMTRIVRGRIKNHKWIDEEVVFEASHDSYITTRHHYGSRIVFDPDGYLYFSIGERGRSEHAQELSLPNGKVHRVFPNGKIPDSNPFIDKPDVVPSIYSYGNRNIQGMAVHPITGEVWASEHGPMGGDELNLIKGGSNYGWPEISYGKNYNGTILTEYTEKSGMEQPNLHWTPSIAVCGIDFYSGELFPKWKNRLLVGALKYEEVRLVSIVKDRIIHDEVILKNAGRVRDVACGPDGAIYVVLNKPGTILRLTPDAK
jgi:glucose/arabinose dehydrogenase